MTDWSNTEAAVHYIQTAVQERYVQQGTIAPMAVLMVVDDRGVAHSLVVQALGPCPPDLIAATIASVQNTLPIVATITASEGADGAVLVVALQGEEARAWAAVADEGQIGPFAEVEGFADQLKQMLKGN